MKQITKNFNEDEFRCTCCNKLDYLDHSLVKSLQQLRDLIEQEIGEHKIVVNCGYRCRKHNEELGSKETSQHRLGKAADIVISGITPIQVAKYASRIKLFKTGGIGVYNNFVHVDVRGKVARWGLKWN